MKKTSNTGGDKLDKIGGKIIGNLDVSGTLKENGNRAITDKKFYYGSCNDINETCVVYVNNGTDCPPQLNGVNYGFLFTTYITDNYISQLFYDSNSQNEYFRRKIGGIWKDWEGRTTDNLKSTSTTSALSANQGKALNEKINNINSILTTVSSNALEATTGTTTEITLLETTIAKKGIYLFTANIPVNYYGQSGRDLLLRLKVNNVEKWYNDGVCNTYIYTLSTSLIKILDIPENANVKITIQDATGKTYACAGFALTYIRLRET